MLCRSISTIKRRTCQPDATIDAFTPQVIAPAHAVGQSSADAGFWKSGRQTFPDIGKVRFARHPFLTQIPRGTIVNLMALAPGTRLRPYEITAPLGAGGMGEVYKARDTRLNRVVAIKVSNEQFSERFEREAHAVAALNHSNVCTLHDVGPNYLVMEYIEGTPLKGPLPLRSSAEVCRTDLRRARRRAQEGHHASRPEAREYSRHQSRASSCWTSAWRSCGAGHRNPPSDATLTMALTGKNEIVGTLYYMSPEQLQAQGTGQEIDARSDIFSFGLVLYEMLTGKRAFEGSSPASVIAAIMERPAPSIADDRALRLWIGC